MIDSNMFKMCLRVTRTRSIPLFVPQSLFILVLLSCDQPRKESQDTNTNDDRRRTQTERAVPQAIRGEVVAGAHDSSRELGPELPGAGLDETARMHIRERLSDQTLTIDEAGAMFRALLAEDEATDSEFVDFIFALHEEGLLQEPNLSRFLFPSFFLLEEPSTIIKLSRLVDAVSARNHLLRSAFSNSIPPDYELLGQALREVTDDEVRIDLLHRVASNSDFSVKIHQMDAWIALFAFDLEEQGKFREIFVDSLLTEIRSRKRSVDVETAMTLAEYASNEQRPIAVGYIGARLFEEKEFNQISVLAERFDIPIENVLLTVSSTVPSLNSREAEELLQLLPDINGPAPARVGAVDSITDAVMREVGVVEGYNQMRGIIEERDIEGVLQRTGFRLAGESSLSEIIEFGESLSAAEGHLFYRNAALGLMAASGVNSEVARLVDLANDPELRASLLEEKE